MKWRAPASGWVSATASEPMPSSTPVIDSISPSTSAPWERASGAPPMGRRGVSSTGGGGGGGGVVEVEGEGNLDAAGHRGPHRPQRIASDAANRLHRGLYDHRRALGDGGLEHAFECQVVEDVDGGHPVALRQGGPEDVPEAGDGHNLDPSVGLAGVRSMRRNDAASSTASR